MFLLAFQIFVSTVTFGIAFAVFKAETSISLVPYSECGECTTCEAQYSLARSKHMNVAPMLVRTTSDGKITNEYQRILFHGEWDSCGSLMTSSFTFDSLKLVKSAYVMFPFNRNGLEMWKEASSPVDAMYYGTGDPQSRAGIPQRDQVKTTILGSFWGTTQSSWTYEVNGSTADVLTPEGNCFRLNCGAQAWLSDVYNSSDETQMTEIFATNVSYRAYQVKVSAEMTTTDKAVMGSCTGVVFGQPIVFFSVSKSIVQEISYLCTTETNWFNAASLALSISASVLGATNVLKYLPTLNRGRSGFMRCIVHSYMEMFS